jgi:hypothetical protein
MCRNIDLPMGAFSVNRLVSPRRLLCVHHPPLLSTSAPCYPPFGCNSFAGIPFIHSLTSPGTNIPLALNDSFLCQSLHLHPSPPRPLHRWRPANASSKQSRKFTVFYHCLDVTLVSLFPKCI